MKHTEIETELLNKNFSNGRSLVGCDTYTNESVIALDDVVDLLHEKQEAHDELVEQNKRLLEALDINTGILTNIIHEDILPCLKMDIIRLIGKQLDTNKAIAEAAILQTETK